MNEMHSKGNSLIKMKSWFLNKLICTFVWGYSRPGLGSGRGERELLPYDKVPTLSLSEYEKS